jgi:hypothetical protein
VRGDIREELIATVTSCAGWRAAAAQEHPDDLRSAACAAALERAARELRDLSDDDPRLLRLERLVYRADEEVAGQYFVEAGDIIARHGFDCAASTDDLLAALLEAAEAVAGRPGPG